MVISNVANILEVSSKQGTYPKNIRGAEDFVFFFFLQTRPFSFDKSPRSARYFRYSLLSGRVTGIAFSPYSDRSSCYLKIPESGRKPLSIAASFAVLFAPIQLVEKQFAIGQRCCIELTLPALCERIVSRMPLLDSAGRRGRKFLSNIPLSRRGKTVSSRCGRRSLTSLSARCTKVVRDDEIPPASVRLCSRLRATLAYREFNNRCRGIAMFKQMRFASIDRPSMHSSSIASGNG